MESLINQSTIVRYKLDQIPKLNYSECIDALQLLNYLLRRAESDEARIQIKTFIDRIDSRVERIKKSPDFMEDGQDGQARDENSGR